MKAISFIVRSLALLAVLLLAVPQIGAAGPSEDAALTKAVQAKLMDGKDFDATSVIVTSKDGVVNLRGEVMTDRQVALMKAAAESVPGVTRVETQIEVKKGNR